MGKLKEKGLVKTTKKFLSVALLTALVVTSVPMVQADAATKPKLNKKKVTIRVGKKYTLKVVNKIKGSKYTWKSNKKKVATVTKKGVVKGKKKGNAVITCTVKAPSKTYKLTCNVKVKKAAATTKPTPTPTVNTSATVSTQSELESALKNEALTSILLKTDAESKFSIPAGTYSKKTLTVNAPNADVENEGIFKEVKIQEIKASTWTEKAKGNILRLLDKSIRVIIEKTAQVKEIIAEGSDASVNLEVEGTVIKLTIKKKTKIDVTGSNKEAIPVEVTSEGKDTELTSEVPVNVSLNADVQMSFKKGAEGSKVDKKVDSITIVVENETGETIIIITLSGNQTVSAGSKVTSEAKGDTTTTTTPGTSGGSGGGGGGSASTPSTTPSETPPSEDPDPNAATMEITPSGTGDVDISGDNITVSGSAVEVTFTVKVTNATGEIVVTSGNGISLKEGTTPITIADATEKTLTFTIDSTKLANDAKITFTPAEAMGIVAKSFNIIKKSSTDNGGETPTPIEVSLNSIASSHIVTEKALIPNGENTAKIKITGTVATAGSITVTASGNAIKTNSFDSIATTANQQFSKEFTVEFNNAVGNDTFEGTQGLVLKMEDKEIAFVKFELKTN